MPPIGRLPNGSLGAFELVEIGLVVEMARFAELAFAASAGRAVALEEKLGRHQRQFTGRSGRSGRSFDDSGREGFAVERRRKAAFALIALMNEVVEKISTT